MPATTDNRSKILLGQNVTPRHRGALRLLPALCGMVGGLIGFALAPWPLHSAPAWPPAGVTLVPAIPTPQGHVTAYVETDQHWLVSVTWEPKMPGRFLGVEARGDSDVCRVHVAAEASYLEQLRAVQDGTATCFTRAFTQNDVEP